MLNKQTLSSAEIIFNNLDVTVQNHNSVYGVVHLCTCSLMAFVSRLCGVCVHVHLWRLCGVCVCVSGVCVAFVLLILQEVGGVLAAFVTKVRGVCVGAAASRGGHLGSKWYSIPLGVCVVKAFVCLSLGFPYIGQTRAYLHTPHYRLWFHYFLLAPLRSTGTVCI